jgi:hypothetical protein
MPERKDKQISIKFANFCQRNQKNIFSTIPLDCLFVVVIQSLFKIDNLVLVKGLFCSQKGNGTYDDLSSFLETTVRRMD